MCYSMVVPFLFGRIVSMNMQKIQENPNVYIAFHVPTDDTANQYIAGMQNSLQEVFQQYYYLEESHFVHELDVLEFIYRIQCPVLMSSEALHEFFTSIQKVFNAHAALNPHFTQFNDSQRGDQ